MTPRIEDYALIGDLQTAALVERSGSIDWLCFPRFDSGACFAALLGTRDHGRWLVAPTGGGTSTRSYLHDTMVLETMWENDEGRIRVGICLSCLTVSPRCGDPTTSVRVTEERLAIRPDAGAGGRSRSDRPTRPLLQTSRTRSGRP